ncbi:MAG TPA: hypothetical protein VGQ95_00675 [Chthoniobacterales bacterium]|nr:hypothetical protein [Chthoniobacterales bacterium]
MGPLFVILIWFFLAAMFSAFWTGAFLLFISGRRRKSRVATCLGGLLLVCITLPAIAVVGLVANSYARRSNPRLLYTDIFHERPSADIEHLRSKSYSFADEEHTFMRFEASPESFHHIVPKHMKKVSYSEYQKEMPGNNLDRPSWWNPPTQKTSEIYLFVPDWGSGHHFASESELLTYDVETKTALYFFLGID